uniref:Uncharacterized protein n=1 Tax=Panagrolaimus superbus TaxID=310955 RepID=A0A914YXL7_9BILA
MKTHNVIRAKRDGADRALIPKRSEDAKATDANEERKSKTQMVVSVHRVIVMLSGIKIGNVTLKCLAFNNASTVIPRCIVRLFERLFFYYDKKQSPSRNSFMMSEWKFKLADKSAATFAPDVFAYLFDAHNHTAFQPASLLSTLQFFDYNLSLNLDNPSIKCSKLMLIALEFLGAILFNNREDREFPARPRPGDRHRHPNVVADPHPPTVSTAVFIKVTVLMIKAIWQIERASGLDAIAWLKVMTHFQLDSYCRSFDGGLNLAAAMPGFDQLPLRRPQAVIRLDSDYELINIGYGAQLSLGDVRPNTTAVKALEKNITFALKMPLVSDS